MSTDAGAQLLSRIPFDGPPGAVDGPHGTLEEADFTLHPEEVSQGRRAAEQSIEALKERDQKRGAAEALEALALLVTDGVCDALEFPWQQLRSYHAALALRLLKEKGTPTRLEALRFRRDPTRKYRQVPERFSTQFVQRARHQLRRVMKECHALGLISEEEFSTIVGRPKAETSHRGSPRGEALNESEVRALMSVCARDDSPLGHRDALIFHLGYECGLTAQQMSAANLGDLHFDPKTGNLTLRVKAAKGRRGRTVPLLNGALIALEDWLEARDREDGPLFCDIGRAGRIELKRLSPADLSRRCRTRAEQAGVEPFSANDLGKSHKTRQPRKKSKVREIHPGATALYATPSDEQATGALKVHFAYPRREQNG